LSALTSRRSLPYSSSVFSSAIVRGLLKERIIIGKNGERFVLTATWLSTVGRYIGHTIIPLAWCDRSLYTDERRLSHDLYSRSRYDCAGKRNERRNYTNKNMITRILILNHVAPEALNRSDRKRCVSFRNFAGVRL